MDKKDTSNIDKNYLTLLRTIQEIHEKKQQLQNCISSGYFNMSKARYVMGMKQISELNYSPQMKAETTVNVNCDEPNCPSFEVTYLKHSEKSEEIETKSNLKNRKEPENLSSEKTIKTFESSESIPDQNDEDVTFVDPLNWFGILVPQALRQSQIEFRKAAVLAGDISSLESKLKNMENMMTTKLVTNLSNE